MGTYETRSIRFRDVHATDSWRTKVYTISMAKTFDEQSTHDAALARLPEWLGRSNGFNDEHQNAAFLILHSGNEGVFSLIHWWVGPEMLTSHIFLTERNAPTDFREISGHGLAPCTWELAVVWHERQAWVKHVLAAEPADFGAYFADVFNGDV